MLDRVQLPHTGRTTTQLGFGGSGLMGGLSERESLRLLETALDAGIRHFDVAPSYGHGQAERCLGKFLRGKRDAVSVTTKYGILPPRRAGWLEMARRVVRPIALRVPAVRARAARVAASLTTQASFRAAEAGRSLENSLRELGLDRIDLFLLHEATADDLESSDLLPALRQWQAEGRIGAYGCGSERRRLDALWQRHPACCQVMQYEWSALHPVPAFPGAFCIRHRAISGAFAQVAAELRQDPLRRRRWSDAVDADLANPATLAGLLLAACLESDAGGIVLFSSRSPAHIQANVRFVRDAANLPRAGRFLDLLAGR